MGSWIICTCGARIHKNLFAGAGASVLASDEVLDSLSQEDSVDDAIDALVIKGDVVVRCHQCNRLYVERDNGDTYECYTRERTSRSCNFLDTTYDIDPDKSDRDA